MKKGQITAFIIIGLVIIGLFGVIIFYTSSMSPTLIKLPPKTGNVHFFIENCISTTLKSGVEHIAFNGGYNTLPESSTTTAYKNAPYYYIDRIPVVPSLEILELELRTYMDQELLNCVDVGDNYLETEFKESQTQISIQDEVITATVHLPTKIDVVSTVSLETFKVSIPSTLFIHHLASQKIIDFSILYGEDICLDCINTVAQELDVQISTLEKTDTEIFYIIESDQDSLQYRFAAKYDGKAIINYADIFDTLKGSPWLE